MVVSNYVYSKQPQKPKCRLEMFRREINIFEIVSSKKETIGNVNIITVNKILTVGPSISMYSTSKTML